MFGWDFWESIVNHCSALRSLECEAAPPAPLLCIKTEHTLPSSTHHSILLPFLLAVFPTECFAGGLQAITIKLLRDISTRNSLSLGFNFIGSRRGASGMMALKLHNPLVFPDVISVALRYVHSGGHIVNILRSHGFSKLRRSGLIDPAESAAGTWGLVPFHLSLSIWPLDDPSSFSIRLVARLAQDLVPEMTWLYTAAAPSSPPFIGFEKEEGDGVG